MRKYFRCFSGFFFFYVLTIASVPLNGIQLPMYLNWRSSNSFSFYHLNELETSRLKQVYRINTGVDTLFANGIRTRFEITNQDKIIESRVLLKSAVVDYTNAHFMLQVALQDYGFGNDFLLYNRNYDDLLYNENVLLNSRWYGISTGYLSENKSIQLGIGSNDLNWLLCELAYKYKADMNNINVFFQYNLRDSYYSYMDFDAGAEVKYENNWLKLHTGFDYTYMPKSQFFPEMSNWHLVNELNLRVNPKLNLILSQDLQTKDRKNTVHYLYEGCINYNSGKWQSYLGVRDQDVLSNKVLTSFFDLNYHLRDKLTIGLNLDLVRLLYEDSYLKLGVQTSYSLD